MIGPRLFGSFGTTTNNDSEQYDLRTDLPNTYCLSTLNQRPLYDQILAPNFGTVFDLFVFVHHLVIYAGCQWWIPLMIVWRATRLILDLFLKRLIRI